MKCFIAKCILFLTVIFMFSLTNQSHAQSINSINISPQNPTEQDSVFIMVSCTFSGSSCDSSLDYLSVNNHIIYASTTHCMGMLPTTCDATDTFVVSGLPAGSYTFIVNVNQGYLPSCTPGIVPGPTDSLVFNVAVSNDIPIIARDNELLIYPNISTGMIFLRSPAKFFDAEFVVYSINGNEVFKIKTSGQDTRIDLDLEPGSYYCQLKNNRRASGVKKLFITTK